MAWADQMTKFRSRNHRDGDVRRREVPDVEPPLPGRAFRMTDEERLQIAKSLRFIDEARRALQDQQNPDNREIIRELRGSADEIYYVLNELEELA
jgi:hypothetical protein